MFLSVFTVLQTSASAVYYLQLHKPHSDKQFIHNAHILTCPVFKFYLPTPLSLLLLLLNSRPLSLPGSLLDHPGVALCVVLIVGHLTSPR